jgi:putative aldouronate transport system substrate-binding protein
LFDGAAVKTEFAALTNVNNQYKIALEDGMLDPDTTLPKYISALKDAGIEKYVAEKQKQLDAWAKTQGK